METTENLLNEWMCLAKHNKRLHEASGIYYKKFADTSILTAIVMGSTGSILNIVLGAIDPFSSVIINVAQIALGCSGLVATAIITASKQLELEKNMLHHIEHASKYSELHRTIQAELVLIRMNDSSYASKTDFLKNIQHELDRIEENAPTIPEYIEKKMGAKCIVTPTPSRNSIGSP
jgi:hypothetical protein